MRSLTVVWIAAAALFATPALAQVFKWVDDSGRVNYGDKPPSRGSGALPLGEWSGSISVVPGMSKDEVERLRTHAEQERLQRLGREVDELRSQALWRTHTAIPETVYTETYVPAYGYIWPPRRAGFGIPIAKAHRAGPHVLRADPPAARPGTPARSHRGARHRP